MLGELSYVAKVYSLALVYFFTSALGSSLYFGSGLFEYTTGGGVIIYVVGGDFALG